jgi:predicted RNase H-like HicB family nuclease
VLKPLNLQGNPWLKQKFTVILMEEAEGYSAQAIELPGCVSQGKNRKKAISKILDAIEGYLEAFPEEIDQLKRKRELVEVNV